MVHKYPQQNSPKITASVVGARGYSGLELVKLLLDHPAVTVVNAFATKAFQLSDDILDDRVKQIQCMTDDQLMANLTDVVFLATPAEVSAELAPKILAQGKKVIDLSGAFRLQTSDMQKWYGFMHKDALALHSAEYGLAPFCGPSTKANLISNPGCYASAIALALIPLLKHDVIETDGIVIDAKSGTSGAGRKASENQLFAEVDGECLPYKVGKHQHFPEIQEAVAKFAGKQIDPHLTTNLLPTKRGIIAGIYARTKSTDIAAVTNAFAKEFAGYPLVRFAPQSTPLMKLANVVGTPYTHISYELTGNKLYLFSSLDNLMKGAATQAVENFNRVMDFPLTLSLTKQQDGI